jgi:hypothetical protein
MGPATVQHEREGGGRGEDGRVPLKQLVRGDASHLGWAGQELGMPAVTGQSGS